MSRDDINGRASSDRPVIDWDERARFLTEDTPWESLDTEGVREKLMLKAVIDLEDTDGFKNRLVDHNEWNLIRGRLSGCKRLLDFGCGTGRFASRVAGMGIEYTGIDTSLEMLRLARRLNGSLENRIIHFDGLNIPFPEGHFDVCLSDGVLQYIIKSPGIDKVLAEVRRVLGPGGRLILIEQASLAEQASGSVRQDATELEYTEAVSRVFRIKSVGRIRSCKALALTRYVLCAAKYFPWLFSLALNSLAEMEARRVRNADDAFFSSIDYYDILIDAFAE
jgi:SAM-dependent methyltransferase